MSLATSSPCLFWEDLQPGLVVRSGSRSLTDQDLAAFASLTGDHNPLHEDARDTDRMAHGLLGMALAVGLIEETGVHHGSTLAMLEIQGWSFRRPLRVGESVVAVMTIIAATPSSSTPGRGTVTRHLQLLGVNDGLVRQEGTMTLLVARRGHRDGVPA